MPPKRNQRAIETNQEEHRRVEKGAYVMVEDLGSHGEEEMNVAFENFMVDARQAARRNTGEGTSHVAISLGLENATQAASQLDSTILSIAYQFIHGWQQYQQQHERTQEKREQAVGSLKYHFKELSQINVPTFDGSPNPNVVERWLSQVEKKFQTIQVPDGIRSQVVTSFLVSDAEK